MIENYSTKRGSILDLFFAFEEDDESYFDFYPFVSLDKNEIENELKNSETYAYIIDFEPVGMISYDNKAKTIHYLYVKDEFQNQGIASKLFDYIEKEKELNQIMVRNKNTKAINFYEKKGYLPDKKLLLDDSMYLKKAL
jgi:ribosomal protein S18 acetylase RimI-like enzyme